jgi:hypothetical protein
MILLPLARFLFSPARPLGLPQRTDPRRTLVYDMRGVCPRCALCVTESPTPLMLFLSCLEDVSHLAR